MVKRIGLEKRKTQRLKVPLGIEYKLLPQKRLLMEKVFARDISGGGFSLEVLHPMKSGTKLKTLLYFPNEKRPVSSVSEVVWCKKDLRRSSYNVGIRHIRIDPSQRKRFVFLFCETMVNYFMLPRRGFNKWFSIRKK